MWRDDYPKQKKRKKNKKKDKSIKGAEAPLIFEEKKGGEHDRGTPAPLDDRKEGAGGGPAFGCCRAGEATPHPHRNDEQQGEGQRGREARREGGSPATTHAGKGPGRRRCGRRRPVDARPAIPLIGRRLIWAERETGAKGGSRGSIFGHPDPVRPPPPAWPLLPDAGDTAASSMGSERERQRQSKGRDRTHTEPTRTKP